MLPDGTLDFSIYDAKEAGFNKVVCIIRKDIEEDFKESFACWKTVAKVWYNPNLMYFYKNADYILTPTPYSKRCIDSGKHYALYHWR